MKDEQIENLRALDEQYGPGGPQDKMGDDMLSLFEL